MLDYDGDDFQDVFGIAFEVRVTVILLHLSLIGKSYIKL